MVAVLLASVLTVLRPATRPGGTLVEVQGDVPSPGTYLVAPPTVAAAVRAAGGDPGVLGDGERVIPDGHRVRVVDGRAEVVAPSEPLLVGLPLDVNTAEVHELVAIPGLGPSTAGAIVAHREVHGPFRNLDGLSAVQGLGPSSLDRLRPFLMVPNPLPDPPARPVDVNLADATALEALPGIGPVMAARIVVERAEGGPFRSLDDLQRVHGVGPALVEKLEGRAVAGPTSADRGGAP
jgi:competence protein ComEA